MRLLLLFLSSVVFCSLSGFSLVPVAPAPPQQQVQSKKEQRLRKRLHRTTHLHQKQRLQKRLFRLQQTKKKLHPLGKWSLGLGITAFVLMFLLAFCALVVATPFPPILFVRLFVIVALSTLTTALAGLVTSIIFSNRYRSFAEEYPAKEPAKLGLIFCLIALAAILILFIAVGNKL